MPVNKAKRERNGEKSDRSWQRNLSEGTAASQGGCPGEKGGLCSSIFLLLIPAGRAIPLFQGNSVHTGDTTRREPRMPLLPAVPGQCPQRWLRGPGTHPSFPGNTASSHTTLRKRPLKATHFPRELHLHLLSPSAAPKLLLLLHQLLIPSPRAALLSSLLPDAVKDSLNLEYWNFYWQELLCL